MWLGPPLMNSQMTRFARPKPCGARPAIGFTASPPGAAPLWPRSELSANKPMPPPALASSSRRERAEWSMRPQWSGVSMVAIYSRPAPEWQAVAQVFLPWLRFGVSADGRGHEEAGGENERPSGEELENEAADGGEAEPIAKEMLDVRDRNDCGADDGDPG